MTRIAAFGIHHETNSFSSRATTLDSFQRSGRQHEGVQRGSRIEEIHRGARTVFSGFFESAARLHFEFVWILFAATDPDGTIRSDAFERLQTARSRTTGRCTPDGLSTTKDRCAVVKSDAGPTLLLVSASIGNASLERYYSVGIRPEELKIIVAKGVMSPRPAYEPIAAETIPVDSPGATSADLATFDYAHRRRPLYPFEGGATYV